ETRQLSPSGKLVLRVPTSVTDEQTFLNPDLDNDVVLQDSLGGMAPQKIVSYSLQRNPVNGAISGTFQRSIFADFPLDYPADTAPTSPFDQPTTATLMLGATTASAVGACSANDDCAAGSKCDLGFCSTLPAHRFTPNPQADLDYTVQHRRMRKWGPHWATRFLNGESRTDGHWGFYLPGSNYQTFADLGRSGYALHGPVPVVSGEPLADLFAPDGTLLV